MLATSPPLRSRKNLYDQALCKSSARYGSGPVSKDIQFQDSYMAAGDTSTAATQSPITRSSTHSPKQSHSGTSSVTASMQSDAPEKVLRETATPCNESHDSTGPAVMKYAETCANSFSSSPGIKRRQPTSPSSNSEVIPQAQRSTSKKPKGSTENAKVLPERYELCDVKDIVILIADMISELLQTNDNLPLRESVLTRFHSRTPPAISVLDYLHRLAKHAALTPPLLLSMVYYIDLLCSMYPSFTITTLTVHRFLITAATVAAKGLSDSFWNNSTYARVGGIKLAELGLLELEFLYRVDWRIVPDPDVLVDYYRGLVSRTDRYVVEADTHRSPNTHGLAQSLPQHDASRAETASREQARTDNNWDKWMKDVADSTNARNQQD